MTVVFAALLVRDACSDLLGKCSCHLSWINCCKHYPIKVNSIYKWHDVCLLIGNKIGSLCDYIMGHGGPRYIKASHWTVLESRALVIILSSTSAPPTLVAQWLRRILWLMLYSPIKAEQSPGFNPQMWTYNLGSFSVESCHNDTLRPANGGG